MWGPPTGWDSAPSESHHKTEIKAPSKNTQGNASTLIYQTAKRQTELRTLQRATHHYKLNNFGQEKEANSQRPEVGGALFNIMNDGSGVPTMKRHSSWNKSKPTL